MSTIPSLGSTSSLQPGGARLPRILNCRPSRAQHRDWTRLALAPEPDAETSLPLQVDLRAPWWTIGDQGATGSCVGWAVADSVLRWHFVEAGLLEKSQRLSVRFVWMASKETDEFRSQPSTFLEADGTSLKGALEVARRFGVVLDQELPFLTGELSRYDADLFYALAAERRIASYINLGHDGHAWRRWLATQGPILARVEVDTTWLTATAKGGRLDAYQPRTVLGGHAIALVGYTPEYFIVRNSWGTDWGDGGFAYATDSYVREAFTEAYGVTV